MHVTADMASTIWRVLVTPGDTVSSGQELITLETMKMEIPVLSPIDGLVVAVNVVEGEVVGAGSVLAVIESAS